jgi:hypothetical protein
MSFNLCESSETSDDDTFPLITESQTFPRPLEFRDFLSELIQDDFGNLFTSSTCVRKAAFKSEFLFGGRLFCFAPPLHLKCSKCVSNVLGRFVFIMLLYAKSKINCCCITSPKTVLEEKQPNS